ncbi:centaurin-gamma-1A-like [Myzus persicae]|uniref:centaurin-gamma-1A-like n=1 Tax=Myzus persicae TaxID=13164 RepID=UPI000B935700|nr:centaurin-gamma-1A-like [Myzus persicae]
MNGRPSYYHSHSPFSNNSLAICKEIQRFESVHPSIYAIYDLIELIPDPIVAQQVRDHVVCIEETPRGINMRFLDLQVYQKKASSAASAVFAEVYYTCKSIYRSHSV